MSRLIQTATTYSRALEWKIDHQGNPNRYRRGWCEKNGFTPKSLVTVVIYGDSMSPTLEHGTSIVINTADNEPCSEQIYAVVCLGAMHVTRLQIEIDGTIHLKPDNPNNRLYPSWRVAPEHRHVLQILGRAVLAQGNL